MLSMLPIGDPVRRLATVRRFGVSTLVSVLHGDAGPAGLERIRGLLNTSQ